MQYRPEGWENPYQDEPHEECGCFQCGVHLGFEAGADAMLEGLKKGAMFIPGVLAGADDFMLKVGIPNNRGYLVFIPDVVVEQAEEGSKSQDVVGE